MTKLEQLTERLEAAEQRAARAEDRLYSFRQGRAARSKALADLVKSRAPELWPDYAALSVNGSLYTDEITIQPVYEREMDILRYRAEKAEQAAAALRAAGDVEAVKRERDDAVAALKLWAEYDQDDDPGKVDFMLKYDRALTATTAVLAKLEGRDDG